MKSKALIPLVVGVLVGIVAIKYTMDALSKARGAPDGKTVQVIMAQKDIPATVAITADMLVLAETPQTPLLPREVFTELKQLEGRVALKSIPRGSPVLPSMIAPDGTKPGLTTRVPEGFRAVAVKIDESSGVGYLVHPNDWVDVMAVMEVKKLGNIKTESKLILERVQVAAVGQALNEGPEQGANRNVQTVTLLVRVEDVPKLHLAQTRGRVTLAMRGAEDTSTTLKEDDEEQLEMLATTTQPVTAQNAEPPKRNPTHTVTVVNDSSGANARGAMQQFIFPDANSMNVIGVERSGAGGRAPMVPNPTSRDPGETPGESGEDDTNDQAEIERGE